MAVRKCSLLFIAMLLLFSLTGSAEAGHHQQDPQDDIIRQVLTATAADLGWDTSIDYSVTTSGIPHWKIGDFSTAEGTVEVYAYNSASDAEESINGWYSLASLDSGYSLFTFHGNSAISWLAGFGHMIFQADRFEIWAYSSSVASAKNNLESFYRNAESFGLLTGDGATTTPAATETVIPATPVITGTPLPGAPVVLTASKVGYGPATQTVNNVDNLASLILEGQVTDQEGQGVAGADVAVVSGAGSASITTNSDGSYSLALDVPGGQGYGALSGVNFTLQLQGDLTIDKVELLQSVSGAELADSRSTAALVFPRLSSQAPSSVATEVTLYVNGQFFQSLPCQVKNEYTARDHQGVLDAVIFLIPPSFVRSGPFEVRAVIDPQNTFVEPDETNNDKTWTQMVSLSRGLSMVMVALSPDIDPGATQTWASAAREFLANTYPVPSVRSVPHPLYSNGWLNLPMALRDAAIVNNALVAYNAANPGAPVEYAVGLYPPNAYGAGNRGFVYRFLYPNAPLVSIEFPITIAHEIGHIYLGAHEEADDNPSLGGVALPEGYIYEASRGQVRYIKANSNWINFMGDPYAGFEEGSVTVRPWISPSTSNTILDARQSASVLPSKVAALAESNWSAAVSFDRVLYLSGYFENGELRLLPPQILQTSQAGEYPAGDFSVSMQAADGSLLASASFELNQALGEYDAPNPGAFQVAIPYPSEAVRLVITKDGQEYYRLEKSAAAPNVSFDQPGAGTPVAGATTLSWSASDGDGDPLTYNVYYSPDNGTSWQLLGLNWNALNLPVDGSLLPGSEQALIRVVASDGLNTGQADSPAFVVPKHAPTVLIYSPDPDAQPWVAGQPNLLAGLAEDIEDGWLPGQAYQWISDKDGLLGQGNTLYVALSAGQHTITLTVTDADGQPDSASTSIIVGGVGGGGDASGAPAWQLPANSLYWLGGGICVLLAGGLLVAGGGLFLWRGKQTHRPGLIGQGAVQDRQGNWWSQYPQTGAWYFWNGQTWQSAPGEAARAAPPRRSGSACLLAFLSSGLIALVVVGGVSLVAFNFFPAYQITRGQGDLTQILKMGGGGLLVMLLGLLLLTGGFKSILTQRAMITDERGRRREKRGCGAILSGLGQLCFGLVLLAGGLGWLSLVFYQEILPWLGL